jgi:hypothetical protein
MLDSVYCSHGMQPRGTLPRPFLQPICAMPTGRRRREGARTLARACARRSPYVEPSITKARVQARTHLPQPMHDTSSTKTCAPQGRSESGGGSVAAGGVRGRRHAASGGPELLAAEAGGGAAPAAALLAAGRRGGASPGALTSPRHPQWSTPPHQPSCTQRWQGHQPPVP